MKNRTWKWLVPAILIILLTAVTLGAAGAEGKKLTPRIMPADEELIQPRRGGASISGTLQNGETCTAYTYTVNNGTDTGVVEYIYKMAILDDPREGRPADLMYQSDRTTSNTFTYTFYTPGTYVLFAYRYDADGNIIENKINDTYTLTNVQTRIYITQDKAENPLTTAVQTAAAACNKGNDFETAVAINDYLANLFTYDYSFTYYSPEAGLVFDGHTCVCNGYSRAYQLIAKACGLDCRRVNGYAGESHAWDVVKINGKWYQVDPTWNDPTVRNQYGNAVDNSEYRHVYMGLSDDVIGVDHSSFDYPDGLGSVACVSLDDNYFVHTGKWTNLAGDIVEDLQTALNATSGITATITANMNSTRLEGGTNTSDPDIVQINGHIIARALNDETWTRTNEGVTTPMSGEFTYSYTSGNSTLTGEMTALSISGTCGENLTWELNDGVLTISGTGAMEDFQIESSPWYSYIDEITTVNIGSGVTNVGMYAFRNCTNLTSVSLPGTLTRLNNHCFNGCSNLTSIEIPEGVTVIANSVFASCSKLESVSLPESLKTIGLYAFSSCNMTSIVIPDAAKNGLCDGCFMFCLRLVNVTLPAELSGIPGSAFHGCDALTAIEIPASVTFIGDDAFHGCSKLATVEIPSDVTYIGKGAFESCYALTELNIPSGVTELYEYTFTESGLESIVIPSTVTDIGEGAFSYCADLTDIYYTGLKSDWDQISIETGNDPLTLATLHTHYGTPHSWGEVSYSWAIDHSTATATRTCGADPGCIETESVFSTSEITKEATCTTDGERTYTATFTNEAFGTKTETVTDIQATGHDKALDHFERTEATCMTAGNIEYWKCASCGMCFTDENGENEIAPENTVIPIDPNAHDLEHHEGQAATCVEAGWEAYDTCKREGCGYTTYDAIPIDPNAHDLEHHEGQAATCIEAGWEAYDTCKREGCGYTTYEVIPIDPNAHDLEHHEGQEATCVEAGWEAYDTCKREGCEYTTYEVIPIDPNAHDLEHHEGQAATCVQAGWQEYDTCKREGCEYTTYVEIPINPDAHDIEHHNKQEATCVQAGWEAYDTCKREGCGYSTYDEIPIDPDNHDIEHHDTKASTCTAVGWEAYDTCKRNGCHYSTYVEIPKLAHSIDEHHEAVAATEQADGSIEYWVCSVCHHMFSDEAGANEVTSVTIPKLSPSLPPAGNHSDASANYTVNADGTATYKGPKNDIATVTIPATIKVGNFNVPVTKIADKAFKGRKKLKTVTIGSNIKQIGTSAFEGCKKLKTVKGGDNVEKIGDKAYKGCVALTKYTIGAKVNYIGKNAFNGCTKLKTITVKSTLLTSSNVKSGAFKKISAKATFKVPKAKKKEYAKFLPKKGTKTVKVK